MVSFLRLGPRQGSIPLKTLHVEPSVPFRKEALTSCLFCFAGGVLMEGVFDAG